MFLIPGYLHEWRILCGRGVWLCHGVERERVIAFRMASRTRRKEHSLGFLGNT